MQTGIGFDAHKLVPGIDLMLGGVLINHPFGLEGHSDGDVLLHAISDALLGAASMGDIGKYFPSSSSNLKSIASSEILTQTVNIIKDNDCYPYFIDSTIIAQSPILQSYIPEMENIISSLTYISVEKINIKATTTDYLGYIGREEGIAAMAIATIEKSN
tara:strand:+ start:11722 stop:12198 length:477 start_codon:yes stop_codon:yes gene_type:complete